MHRIEVAAKSGQRDIRGETLQRRIVELGFAGIEHVAVSDLYFIERPQPAATLERLVATLLLDPVLEQATIDAIPVTPPNAQAVEVTLLPGVTDSAAESLRNGAGLIGLVDLGEIAVGQRYLLSGAVDAVLAQTVAEQLIVNAVVQTHAIGRPIAAPFVGAAPSGASDRVETIALRGVDDARLLAISRERRLALDAHEMAAIRAHFERAGREPTDAELEMLAQTWSEHCVHKTFRARITYTEAGKPSRMIDGLLKSYIRAATERINKPWVRSAFVDNAGIIGFDEQFDIAFKVETHNHPSALEPFGGANTGVGGVVRDVIGVSARPIANTDVLCFGPEDLDPATLPKGVLHPRRIAEGVTHGIEDYGNKMGIPTVNGAFCYDAGYIANPLVFCGCLGLLPRGSHPREPKIGDLIIVIGGRTGRDGIRGATFSSMEMGVETAAIAGASVQIGHPIHEKQVMEVILAARDERLYTAITDCGAGGLSSAIGEMAAELGAVVQLERVPLKYAGLAPWEVWLSEAQERMVLAVPEAHWPRLKLLCDSVDSEAVVLGHFTGDKRVVLRWGDRVIGDLPTEFLHDGIPRLELSADWAPPPAVDPEPIPEPTAHLLALLARPGTRSSEHIVRRYDHEVQGGTVVKPFTGPAAKGPTDAAVLCPQDVWRRSPAPLPGIAVSNGIAPQLGKRDPYGMAWACIDEAVRNCVAVGADPDRIAILDNFCWGNPRLPDRLGALVRCCEGCHDAALAYGTPFVSGKDSLNNEYVGADGKQHAIPGTLLISAVAIVPDIAKVVTSDLKAAGNLLYIIGETRDEPAGTVPAVVADPLPRYRALHRAIAAGLVAAAHDCSEGGLALAVAEMALGGSLGLEVALDGAPTAGTLNEVAIAFSESLGRIVVEIAPANVPAFEAAMAGQSCGRIGMVVAAPSLRIGSVIATSLDAVDTAFRGHVTGAHG